MSDHVTKSTKYRTISMHCGHNTHWTVPKTVDIWLTASSDKAGEALLLLMLKVEVLRLRLSFFVNLAQDILSPSKTKNNQRQSARQAVKEWTNHWKSNPITVFALIDPFGLKFVFRLIFDCVLSFVFSCRMIDEKWRTSTAMIFFVYASVFQNLNLFRWDFSVSRLYVI